MREKNTVGYPAAHAEIVGVGDQAFFVHCATRLTMRGIFPPGKTNGSVAISAVTRMDAPSRCCSSSRMFIISWAARPLPATARTTTRSERAGANLQNRSDVVPLGYWFCDGGGKIQ